MTRDASDLAHRLGRQAEAVCREYLSSGRREGRYWMVGDVRNTKGRSMFVRLTGPETGKGAAGKWADAATGEHGDLLDVIRESCGLVEFRDIADEARRFLSLPHPEPEVASSPGRKSPVPTGSSLAAKRLFSMAQPITGTLAESYFRRRGITALHGTGSLRFHPRCYYRPDEHSPTETWPALIASVTDLDGHQTGAHRTWLDPNGFSEATLGKAPIETPRRAPRAVAAARQPRSPLLILPPSCSPTRCAGSTSCAMTIRRVTAHGIRSLNEPVRSASRRCRFRRCWVISTRISACVVSTPSGPRSGSNSPRRMSPGSWSPFCPPERGSGAGYGGDVAAFVDGSLWMSERTAPRPSSQAHRTADGPVRQWLRPTIFRRPCGPFHRETKSPASAILR